MLIFAVFCLVVVRPQSICLEHCKEKGIPVFQTYGMTETSSQIVTLAPEYSLEKIGSAGKALFPSQLTN